MLSISRLPISCIVLLCMMAACSKETVGPPAISSVSPLAGKFGTQVEILGSHFDVAGLANVVLINETRAEVIFASENRLVIKAPARAGSGKISVETQNGKAVGPDFSFTYTFTISTIAGAGVAGFSNGYGTVAKFDGPTGLAYWQERVIVADQNNMRIRIVSPVNGSTGTLVGSASGYQDGSADIAQFSRPLGICKDRHDSFYVVDGGNTRIRKVTTPNFVVSTIAGNGRVGNQDGSALNAEFLAPYGIAADDDLNLFVSDTADHVIRKIDQNAATVMRYAGSGTPGLVDGDLLEAKFYKPSGIFLAASGDLYVADSGNNCIRIIHNDTSLVSTVAGRIGKGFVDGKPDIASFNHPMAVIVDHQGILFIADTYNHAIRMMMPGGDVVTLAGGPDPGTTDGTTEQALFNLPCALSQDFEAVYVADRGSHRIRKILVQ